MMGIMLLFVSGWREAGVFLESGAVQEQDGTLGLILGGGGHFSFNSQAGDEGFNFGRAHLVAVLHDFALLQPGVVKEDGAHNPIEAGLFGATGIVLGTQGIADPFEQFFVFLEGVCGAARGVFPVFFCENLLNRLLCFYLKPSDAYDNFAFYCLFTAHKPFGGRMAGNAVVRQLDKRIWNR